MKIVIFKFFRLVFCTLLLLFTTHSMVVQAQASGGEGGGNVQSPVQVVVQIAVTAIVLRVLNSFDLP
jgi:hypothetical protein